MAGDAGITIVIDESGAQQTAGALDGLSDAMRDAEDAARGLGEGAGQAEDAARSLAREIESLRDKARLDVLRAESTEYAEALRDARMAAAHLAASHTDLASLAAPLNEAERAAEALAREIESLRDRARLDVLRAESKEYADAMRDARMAAAHLAASHTDLASLAAPLNDAERAAEALAREIESLRDKARLDVLRAESKEYAEAMRDAGEAAEYLRAKTASVGDTSTATSGQVRQAEGAAKGLGLGGFLVAANAAVELARAAIEAGRAVLEFAAAGERAATVAKNYKGNIEAARKASLGLVDDTTLQEVHALGTALGLTSTEIENLGARAVELFQQGLGGSVAENLRQLINPEIESMKNLGVVIDTNAEKYKGLTEAQRAVAVSREQAAAGAKALAGGLSVEGSEIAAASVQWNNFVGDMQVAAAEFLNSSGLMDMLSEGLGKLKGWFEENRATIEKLVKLGFSLLVKSLERLGPPLDVLMGVFEVGAAIASEFASELEWIGSVAMGLANPIAAVADAFTALAETAMGFTNIVGPEYEKALKAIEIAHNGAAAAAAGHALAEQNLAEVVTAAMGRAGDLGNRFAELGGDYELLAEDIVGKSKNISEAFNKVAMDVGIIDSAIDAQKLLIEELEATAASLKGWSKESLDAYEAVKVAKDELVQLENASIGLNATLDELARMQNEAADKTDKHRTAVEKLTKAHKEFARIAVLSAFISGSGAHDARRAQLEAGIGVVAGGSVGLGPRGGIRQGSRAETIEDGRLASVAAAQEFGETFGETQTAFGSYVSQLDLDADNLSGVYAKILQASGDATMGIIEDADALTAAFGNIARGAGTFKDAGALISAGARIASSFVGVITEDAQAQAFILGALEVAHALAAIAWGNYPGAAAHFAAAAQYAVVGAMSPSGKGGGSSGGRAGGAANTKARPVQESSFAAQTPRERSRDRDLLETLVVQLQVDGRRLGEEAATGLNASANRYRTTRRIDRGVVGTAGRSFTG